MVVSQTSFSDVRFSADFSTLEQLRTGSAPNAWESAWAVFGHTDDEHFYYVAFKPNGWELGKVDPAYPGAQRYLATGSTPTCAIGTEHSFDIQQDGNVISVSLDGVLLTTFTDNERPYLSGSIGFYTEDAKVAFDNVSGSLWENFESLAPQTLADGASLGTAWHVEYLGYGSGAIERAGVRTTPSHTSWCFSFENLPRPNEVEGTLDGLDAADGHDSDSGPATADFAHNVDEITAMDGVAPSAVDADVLWL